jgi:hypothetical protein
MKHLKYFEQLGTTYLLYSKYLKFKEERWLIFEKMKDNGHMCIYDIRLNKNNKFILSKMINLHITYSPLEPQYIIYQSNDLKELLKNSEELIETELAAEKYNL